MEGSPRDMDRLTDIAEEKRTFLRRFYVGGSLLVPEARVREAENTCEGDGGHCSRRRRRLRRKLRRESGGVGCVVSALIRCELVLTRPAVGSRHNSRHR